MKEYSVKEIESLLRRHGYERVRSSGSHIIWKRGSNLVSVPSATLKPIIAHKIVRMLDSQNDR